MRSNLRNLRAMTKVVLVGTLTAGQCLAQAFTTLITLPAADSPPTMYSPLLQGSDGNFYGETPGKVFKLTPAGIVTTLYTPTGTSAPGGFEGGLIQASDGNFYGTSAGGGSKSEGTVFKLTPGGSLTTLHSFGSNSTDGSGPFGGIIQATDGNFYGTTAAGGSNNKGTIFKITTSGTLTILYTFGSSATDGSSPECRLVQGSDGNFYGTTLEPNAGSGTVFRITQSGVFTTLYSFGSHAADGYGPSGGVIQASDGNLYGMTLGGGKYGGGTVFKITPAGALTTIYSFGTSTTDGGGPYAPLFQAADGNLYGTTEAPATLFRITTSGALTTLHTFSGSDGTLPQSALIQATDGTLYGTTTGGGTVFKFFLPVAPVSAPAITSGGIVPVYSTVATIQAGEWISIYGTNLAAGTAIWNGDFPLSLGNTSVTIDGKAAYLWFVSPTQINLQAPADTGLGTVPVVVTTPGGSATSTVTLAQYAPSFSLVDTKHVAGIILRSNGSGAYGGGSYDIVGPTGSSLGYPTVAAKAGDTVVIFGVGFGPTSPSVPAGAAFSGSAPTTHPVTLLVNNATTTLLFSGETSAGLYQLNFTVPPGTGTGDVPLQAITGGVQTPVGPVISLQ